MDVLDDLLDHDLPLVIVGTAVGECAFRRGHYYAGPGQSFWTRLAGAGLTPHVLAPQEDASLLEHGIGLTDLIKVEEESQGRRLVFDVPGLDAKLSHHRPRWVAFNGKIAATHCARWAGHRAPGLGLQDWAFAGAPVFVLPSSSGANRRRDYDGRPDRASWWNELGDLLRQDAEPAQARSA
ncbi:mismatch-specific DNA-glycosylase [Ornithinimicrobium sufpigmenti]|uniref:mismatch-specific DNA-glycosylase n=1 Tax=Ornithinimicrobium sufpigmenti TaxID=2508882 RepID=UPI0015E1A24C|nr:MULTISPECIES: mismatch-specific DNA-glycosylase [unclassified Ornithinimicrobium]